jgi:hypothetical protein
VPIKGPQSTITPALLTDVAYIEGFFTNILSLARLKGQHIHFNSGRDLLYRQNPKHTAAFLEYRDEHWLIDADPSSRPNPSAMMTMAASRRTRPSRDLKPDLKVTPTQAHQLWGHAAPSAIAHLHNAVRGIQVTNSEPALSTTQCHECIISKMHQLVSRQIPDSLATKPFERIAINLIYLISRGSQCYNGDRYGVHSVCQFFK